MDDNELYQYIKNYRGMVYRLSYSYLKSHEDAEDISQEVFLKLYHSNENFDSENNVKAWLIRVTINLSKNLLKTVWRKRRVELDDNLPYENREENVLYDIIMNLKPKYSIIIHLFYYEGYSVNEISKICSISSSTVRTRLNRARNQLKTMLLKEGFNETEI